MYNNRVIECSRLTDYTFHLIHVVNLLQLLLNSFQMILVFVVVYGFSQGTLVDCRLCVDLECGVPPQWLCVHLEWCTTSVVVCSP